MKSNRDEASRVGPRPQRLVELAASDIAWATGVGRRVLLAGGGRRPRPGRRPPCTREDLLETQRAFRNNSITAARAVYRWPYRFL